MTEKDIQFQLDLLWRDGYHAAARIIETLHKNTISREVEFKYLRNFVQQSSFEDKNSRDQLRCLWTAYCFHQNLDPDMFEYDNDLLELWSLLFDRGHKTADWEDTEGFEGFMCCYLV